MAVFKVSSSKNRKVIYYTCCVLPIQLQVYIIISFTNFWCVLLSMCFLLFFFFSFFVHTKICVARTTHNGIQHQIDCNVSYAICSPDKTNEYHAWDNITIQIQIKCRTHKTGINRSRVFRLLYIIWRLLRCIQLAIFVSGVCIMVLGHWPNDTKPEM